MWTRLKSPAPPFDAGCSFAGESAFERPCRSRIPKGFSLSFSLSLHQSPVRDNSDGERKKAWCFAQAKADESTRKTPVVFGFSLSSESRSLVCGFAHWKFSNVRLGLCVPAAHCKHPRLWRSPPRRTYGSVAWIRIPSPRTRENETAHSRVQSSLAVPMPKICSHATDMPAGETPY